MLQLLLPSLRCLTAVDPALDVDGGDKKKEDEDVDENEEDRVSATAATLLPVPPLYSGLIADGYITERSPLRTNSCPIAW